jgi:hypothetical protein
VKKSFALACTVIGTHKNIIKDAVAIIHSHVTGTTCVLTRRGRQRNRLLQVCAFYDDMKHLSWKSVFHNELAVSLTLSVQLRHIPPLLLILSMSDFPAASSSSPLLYLSIPVYQALLLPLLLLVLSWNKAFHALHVIINDILSVCLLTFYSVCLVIVKILGG